LGRYVGSLNPDRVASVRTLALGVVLLVVALVLFVRYPDLGWPVRAIGGFVGVVGLVSALFGGIELLPGPGQLYLFEHGFVHRRRDGQADALPYGASERGEALRRHAVAMRSPHHGR